MTVIPHPPADAPAPVSAAQKLPQAWAQLYAPGRVGRDIGYVLPGFLVSLIAFSVLVPLTALGISTLIVWIGALVLPAALLTASAFARLSRNRARWWGAEITDPNHRRRAPGVGGLARVMGEGRRWLELAFETLIAFPARVLTFTIGLSWLAAALGGTTWSIWARFLPANDSVFPGNMLMALSGGTLATETAYSRGAEALTYTVFGVVALALLPIVFRALALLDVALTQTALGFGDAQALRSGGTPNPRVPGATGAAAGAEVGASVAPDSRVTSTGWAWIAAAFAAVATIAVTWPLAATLYRVHPALAMLLALVAAAALLAAVRWPTVTVALATVAPVFSMLAGTPTPSVPWPWPVTLLIVQALLIVIVGLRAPWQWLLALWSLPQVAVIATLAATGGSLAGATATNLIVTASVTLGVALVAIATRAALTHLAELRRERQHAADLSRQQRAQSERTTVARELHDVVAHSMSVVSVQANTAKYRLSDLSDEAQAEFDAIASSSRQALGEMRGLLETLRDRDNGAPLAPQPTLADLPALIDASRQSGATIHYDGSGARDAAAHIPAATSLTAYRVVQEALSNAIRHAPGADITVTVAAAASALEVRVDNGRAAPPAGQHGGGSGLGLAGLRERTLALGGDFEAGATASGFSVRAVLPLAR